MENQTCEPGLILPQRRESGLANRGFQRLSGMESLLDRQLKMLRLDFGPDL